MLKRITWYGLIAMTCYILIMAGCTKVPPRNKKNICSVFRQYPTWYWDAAATQKKWGVPISVQMAIVYQESRFQATVKPARKKILWIIPWKRPTTAYGYSQALDGTWDRYQKHTKKRDADRAIFSDAVDFIGWYAARAEKRLGIPKSNARNLYLAYHEGLGGYSTGTYLQKPWLMKVADNVGGRSIIYRHQLGQCEKELPKKPWWRFW